MAKPKMIIVKTGKDIMLTVPGEIGVTCVYVCLEKGKLVITGGASIIERIEGENMREKVVRT
jgi:hypothetical protein